MDQPFGWCFIGAGSIVRRVMQDLCKTKGGYLAAICSRHRQNAQEIAQQYGAKAYSSIEEAILAPNVQAVYVATPHALHREHCLAALRLGKPVLCEKPLATSYKDAQEIIKTAQKHRCYLMEGFWTRFNPVTKQVLNWIQNDAIGPIRSLRADFASRCENPDSRLFKKSLGGGALLDIGVYTIAFSQWVMNSKPSAIHTTAQLNRDAIDTSCAIHLHYPDGAIARLFASIEVRTPHDAWIYGDNGMIRIPKFWAADKAELITAQGTTLYQGNKNGEGFYFEFDAVMEDILSGRLENVLLPHQSSLEIMEIINQIQTSAGL